MELIEGMDQGVVCLGWKREGVNGWVEGGNLMLDSHCDCEKVDGEMKGYRWERSEEKKREGVSEEGEEMDGLIAPVGYRQLITRVSIHARRIRVSVSYVMCSQ